MALVFTRLKTPVGTFGRFEREDPDHLTLTVDGVKYVFTNDELQKLNPESKSIVPNDPRVVATATPDKQPKGYIGLRPYTPAPMYRTPKLDHSQTQSSLNASFRASELAEEKRRQLAAKADDSGFAHRTAAEKSRQVADKKNDMPSQAPPKFYRTDDDIPFWQKDSWED